MFGNVRELIFDHWGKKMHYLDIEKVCRCRGMRMQYKKELVIKQALFVSFQIDSPDTDNVIHEFRWGFRAEQELNKEDVLEVISQVHYILITTRKLLAS